MEIDDLSQLPVLKLRTPRHTQADLDPANCVPIVPDSYKILIAEIMMYWGSIEAKVQYLAQRMLPHLSASDPNKIQFWSRYRIIKDLIRYDENVLGNDRSIWRLMMIDRPLTARVRNAIAHGSVRGILKNKEGSLHVWKTARTGIEYHSFPHAVLVKVRNLLKNTDSTVEDITSSIATFLRRDLEPSSVPRPSAE